MKQIEEGLHKVHAEAKEQKAQLAQVSMEVDVSETRDVKHRPFVKVDRVDAGSPAASAVSHRICFNLRKENGNC